MIYITYNTETGDVNQFAFSDPAMIKSGKPYIGISQESWKASQGKIKKVVNGEFVYGNPPPSLQDFDKAMQDHLLSQRAARGYTAREPSDYKGSSVARWAQDAQDWIAHRDAVMLYGLQVQNTYKETGVAPTLEEFKVALPVIEWTLE